MINTKPVTQSGVQLNKAVASPALFSLISRCGCAFLAMLLLGAQTVYAESDAAVCELTVNFCYTDMAVNTLVVRTYNGDDDVPFVAYDAKTLNLHDEKTLKCEHSSRCQLATEVGIGASTHEFYPCGTRIFASVVHTTPDAPSKEYLFSTVACRDRFEG